jgi:phosphate transport system substrate-binding protein
MTTKNFSAGGLGYAAGGALLGAWIVLAPPMKASAASALPEYQPKRQVEGVLRFSGTKEMAVLLDKWQVGFRKFHPQVLFSRSLSTTGAAMYGLDMRTADIALMGRQINPYERYGTYERSWIYPVEIEVATGSDRAQHKSPAFAIFVHKDNPIAELDLKQLDGIFGAERTGGWTALSWDLDAARPASGNIRSWGQLGLKDAWAPMPIHVYGPPNQGAGAVTFFQQKVLHGGAMWNEDLREYPDRAKMLSDLSADPGGIAYGPLSAGNAGVKAVALAERPGGPVVPLTRDSVAARAYPLARPVYVYFTIDNEKSEFADPRVDPKIDEFVHYVLSRQGQDDVANEASYLPLPGSVVRSQIEKLESKASPPEHDVLEE